MQFKIYNEVQVEDMRALKSEMLADLAGYGPGYIRNIKQIWRVARYRPSDFGEIFCQTSKPFHRACRLARKWEKQLANFIINVKVAYLAGHKGVLKVLAKFIANWMHNEVFVDAFVSTIGELYQTDSKSVETSSCALAILAVEFRDAFDVTHVVTDLNDRGYSQGAKHVQFFNRG